MKLIADSGSSKITWACLPDNSSAPIVYEALGNNPLYGTEIEAKTNIQRSLPKEISSGDIQEIYYYGAGVLKSIEKDISNILSSIFPNANKIFVSNDLIGAARALLGRQSGFAAILGTGMNSCIYNGREIVSKIPSLGFILGDEGSGGNIGKELLKDYIRGNMPPEVRNELAALISMSDDEIISNIYSKPFPNRFCAGFCKYVTDNKLKYDYCHSLIEKVFDDFFKNIVSKYSDYNKYSFNCVGSVAYSNSDILTDTAIRYGMNPGRILQNPIDGLIDFHRA